MMTLLHDLMIVRSRNQKKKIKYLLFLKLNNPNLLDVVDQELQLVLRSSVLGTKSKNSFLQSTRNLPQFARPLRTVLNKPLCFHA